MNNYSYTATDIAGNLTRGVRQAENEQELFSSLRREGLYLKSAQKKKGPQDLKKKLKPNVAADFARQMGNMLDAGVPMMKALEILEGREIDAKKRRLYRKLHEYINSGLSLSESMAKCGKIFPPLMINLVRAGESSGTIEQSFAKLADYFQKEHKTTSKVKLAFTYPIILSVVALAVTLILFVGVLPTIFDLFEGLELPLITQIIMGISNGIINYWYVILGGVFLLTVFVIWLLKQPAVKKKFDRQKVKFPKVGKLMQVIYTERFARTLSSMYSSGVSMVEALVISAEVVNNIYIKEQLLDACERIKEGSSLGESLEQIDGLDRKLTSAIFVGEESGRLEELLVSLSDTFDYDSEMAIQKLISLIEPVTIVVLAIGIGIIAIAVMIPLFSIYSAV